MALVAGIDSSTQSCTVVICDVDTGQIVRSASAPHPDGTAADPEHWWSAAQRAIATVGGLDDVSAISVGAQQHGMVCLDEAGDVVRDALLWNDTRSAHASEQLIGEGPLLRRGTLPESARCIRRSAWGDHAEPELREHRPCRGGRSAQFDGVLRRQDTRRGGDHRANRSCRRWRTIGSRAEDRARGLRRNRARPDTRRVRRPGRRPPGGLGAVRQRCHTGGARAVPHRAAAHAEMSHRGR